jgi:hypothetical protein
MSLHKFAEQVAANGRGDDSLLVHMTPDEVRNLQRFAEANGTTLTINPTTGLPEAGLLSDLFKSIAPIALGAFLGPGAFGIAGMGLSAGTAGLITGGITSLATGSLSRGLMAGLGAYGGAGLAQGFADAGVGAGMSEALAGSSSGNLSQAFGDVASIAGDGSSGQAFNEFLKSSANPATMSGTELAASGLKAAATDPMAFAKQNFGNIAAAAAPIMAGAMVPTTTKMPENTNPAYIRQKLYDPYTQTYKSLTPVKASEWGGRNFSDAYTNPQTGQMATLDQRAPSPMANGGIVALAKGGVGSTLAIMQDNASAGQPSMAEWLDKVGISQEAREKGSPELSAALTAYSALGSTLDPYRQKDTRDWASVMAAENPTEALIQQNLPLYGGAGSVDLTDTGGMLVSGAGNPLTSDLSRYEEFGIKPNTAQLKSQMSSIDTSTPMGRAQYNRINALYEEAVRQAQEGVRTMAGGGIVALAGGGVPGYAPGGYVPSDTDIFNYFKTPGLSDAKIAQDMATFGVSAADIARATGTQGQQADYEKRFVNTLIAPGTDASEFLKATGAVGLKDQSLATAMQNAGLSQGAQYALTHAIDDKGYTGGIVDASTGKPVDFYKQIGYTAGALPGDQGGLEGLYGNINYGATGLQNLINSGKMTVAEAQNAALSELERTKLSLKDVEAATGKKFGDLFKPKTVTPLPPPPPQPDPFVSVVPGGFYGRTDGSTPGDITTNKDGTVTVHPNIPYRPDGGFSGMGEVRDAYTRGGGSLGYTSRAPKTIDEFNQLYNRQTGDSLAAYDYLMGKGGGKYPVQSQAAATGINRPYWGEGMRYKPKFLSYDKEGNTVSSTTNPNAPKSGDAKAADLTKAKTIDIVDSSGYNTETYTAVLQEDGTYLAGNGKRYDVTGKQIAAGGGMMGYAMGGSLGSLGSYSDGGRLLKGPGDGVSDSIPATIGRNQQPARLADGEFVIPARIVSELGNGSTDAGAKKLYAMMDRVQRARGKTTGKNKVAANSRADKHLPA